MYPYAACMLRKVPYVYMVSLQKNNTDTKYLRVCCSQCGIYSPISQCVVNRTAHLKDRELIHLHRPGPYQRSIARSLWILIHKSEILSQKPKPLFSERQSLGWWDAHQVRCLLHTPWRSERDQNQVQKAASELNSCTLACAPKFIHNNWLIFF